MINEKEKLVLLLDLLFLHHLLWPAAGESSSTSLAFPGCPDNCGKIPIPYPFGTRDGCYRKDDESNQTFLITCDDTYSPPKPFLAKGNIQVYELSLERVVVDNTVASICFNESGEMSSEDGWIHLKPWYPYTFSDVYNRFVVLGCNVEAVISDESTFRTSCRTYCSSKESLKNGSCNGIGCCQTVIPRGLKHIDISIPTILDGKNNHSLSFAPCSYALVGDKDRFNFSTTYLMDPNFLDKEGYAFPAVFDWAVGNLTCEEARENSSNFACRGNSTCTNSADGPGYRCSCLPGYNGNPYLPQGCQDIDECENKKDNLCTDKCVNIVGNYTCSCPEGTYGDGRRDGEGCKKKIKSFPATKIILGVVLVLVLVCAVGSSLYWLFKRRKIMKRREKFFEQNGGFQLQQIYRHTAAADTSKIFTAKELQMATNNFDDTKIIGKGGYGTVYKGILSDNRVVAIKKSKTIDESQIEQFINEVFILSQINHRNVVKLLGCCLETSVPLLVYEYVNNGTLSQHIHDKTHVSFLSWNYRLRIASETAAALAYLHSATSTPIIHRDVKSANILLDDNFTAKVSDFGASRLVPIEKAHLTTLVLGTSGYLDPEYLRTSQLTDKSDVYSFGVVLVELLTGKKPISFERCEEERNLTNYFLLSVENNRLPDILDQQIVDEVGIRQLLAVAGIAKRCLFVKGNERPTMKEVAAELEGLRRF